MNYKYLIQYLNEPIAVADDDTSALKAIYEDIKFHKTKKEDYNIVGLKYYKEEQSNEV